MDINEQVEQREPGPAVWFDALAHTVTVDGDWPRCAGCGEYGSHEQCQPESVVGLDGAAADAAVAS